MAKTSMRVNKDYTQGVKESMPQIAFSYSGLHHSGGGGEIPNRTKPKPQNSPGKPSTLLGLLLRGD